MTQRNRHLSADLSQPIEWRRGTPYYQGKPMHYDFVAARLAASEKKIYELLKALNCGESESKS